MKGESYAGRIAQVMVKTGFHFKCDGKRSHYLIPSHSSPQQAATALLACSSCNTHSPSWALHLLFLLPGALGPRIWTGLPSTPHSGLHPNIAFPRHVWSPCHKLLLCCWPFQSANHTRLHAIPYYLCPPSHMQVPRRQSCCLIFLTYSPPAGAIMSGTWQMLSKYVLHT